MVTIGIDYTPAHEQGGGIGRLVRELVRSLALIDASTNYRLFVAGAQLSDLPPLSSNFAWSSTIITPLWLARIWHRLRLPIPLEYLVGSIDLFHATDFVLPPLRSSTKSILTVHDLSYIKVPYAASPRLRAYLDSVVPDSLLRSDLILADSVSTKTDIVEIYGVAESKVEVLLSGLSDSVYMVSDTLVLMTMRNKYNIPKTTPYLLSVGTVQPRKNYSRIIKALKRLREQDYDICLVIAGGKGWLEDEMYQTIDETGMHDYVHLIGFVEDVDLPALYSDAECVIFPSLYEGFGFPVLEGMACGVPVITSNVSSLPEVAGDAAILVNPMDVEEITDAIQRVLDDTTLRATLIEKGHKQASLFRWEDSARKLVSIYNHVLGM